MKKAGWSGHWPTTEYPPDGTRLRYQKMPPLYAPAQRPDIREACIRFCWCGIEPVFEMDNGDSVFPTLDAYEVVTP